MALVEVRFSEPLDVVAVAGQMFWDPHVDGAEKGRVVKEHIDAPMDRGLMSWLGEQSKALLMQETEDEWELIFHHDHLARLHHHDRIIATFERSPAMPVTTHWTTSADGQRRRYESDRACLETLEELGVARNEEPPWLVAMQKG